MDGFDEGTEDGEPATGNLTAPELTLTDVEANSPTPDFADPGIICKPEVSAEFRILVRGLLPAPKHHPCPIQTYASV